MLVSYNWLNKYFDGKLPAPEAVAEAFTFHAWEIEDVEKIEGDTVLDVKVLPDKSMWGLSHRGIAKDLSVILNLPLNNDPLTKAPALETGPTINITLDSDNCRRFAAAHISGVKVGPSPEWLKTALQAIGQRSINNIVDASNYVMFDLGQPSHAFDAKQVGAEGFKVRHARVGEKLTGLDGIEYTFTNDDTIIARNDNNEILSVAACKPHENVEVPVPSTFRFAVVVAPPKTVRPPACAPLPMVEEAVAKIFVRNDVPLTEIAVEDANGNCEAIFDVAKKFCALGVDVATTTPVPLVARREFCRPETVRLLVEAVVK